jgi:hypothetical protein
MYELKKIGTVFTSKLVATGPSSYEKIIYRAAVSRILSNIALLLPVAEVRLIEVNTALYNNQNHLQINITTVFRTHDHSVTVVRSTHTIYSQPQSGISDSQGTLSFEI